MTTQRPVLVATDFSTAADEALRQGYTAALHRRTRLVVCHILPAAFRVRGLFARESGSDVPALTARAGATREMLRLRADAVLGATSVPVRCDVGAGSPHAGILEVAERVGAALIVTGPGATAGRVARAARFPVLVARPSERCGPVIGATDFSTARLPAINAAAAEAAATGNPLLAMHCLDLEPTAVAAAAGAGGIVPMALVPDDVARDMTAAAARRLDDALTSVGAAGRAVVLRTAPRRGILESSRAEGASMVVVGTHGRAGVSRMLIGSVAEYVAGHAPCAVLIVPLAAPAPVAAGSGGAPRVAGAAAGVMAAVTTLALLAAPSPSAAQSATRDAVTTLIGLMEQAQLDAFATREAADGDVYLSVMHVKGVQLLVVRSRHPVPAALDARIAARDFQGAYADHNGSTLREGKLFVMDMGGDGLVPRPRRGEAFDIAYEDGVRETRFDGDWRRQGLSEDAYRLRVADIEHRYSSILSGLTAALRRPPQ